MNRLKAFAIALLVIATSTAHGQLFNEDLYKFGRALDYVSSYYVDSVNRNSLVEHALVQMLKELDPHSVYLTKEEVKEMNEPLEGNFEGIGIQFNVLDDTLYVISPIAGGPSEEVGIHAGDRIISIDGENVAGVGLSTNGVRDRLLGEKGTKVKVQVKRKGIDKLLSFTITRDKIPIYSLDASYMVEEEIGYIKLNRFAKTTNDEFEKALKSLKKEGANSLVLDLRGNGGGYLNQAIALADEFFDEEKLLVYTEGRKVEKTEELSTDEGLCKDGNLVVLIDEGSASASEIVAGAIQDWDRGIVVGRRSFGKGLVQRQVMLPDGAMIRLTVARYHTPTGRVIQKPYDEGTEAYAMELRQRYEQGELMHRDSVHFPDSLRYKTLVEGREVYGGGGIMPDVFVPLDTTTYTSFSSQMLREGLVNRFVLNYVDEHRDELNDKYESFEAFKRDFHVEESVYQTFRDFGQENDVDITDDDPEKSFEEMSLLIKALVARDLWDMSQYYQIVHERDKGLKQAVEILKNWEKYHTQLVTFSDN
ncbi:MAG: S41 family peptidase [Bacteroidota bacterium]